MTINQTEMPRNGIKFDLCSGCHEKWPTTDLGPYNLCPNCSSMCDMDDPKDIYRND